MQGLGLLGKIAMIAASATVWPQAPGTPPAVAKAHEEYLSGDLKAFAHDAPEAWQEASSSKLMTANMVDLTRKAYDAGHGALKGDLTLPVGVTHLKLSQRRAETQHAVDYVVEFDGKKDAAQKIKELRLVRYPDQVLLAWSDEKFERGEEDGSFWLKRHGREPLAEGLYQVQVTLESGATSEGWVPVVDWASDQSPSVQDPVDEKSYETPNPSISWQPFSTGDRGYVGRGFSAAAVYNDAPDYAWDKKWMVYGKEGDRLSYVIGKDPRGVGVKALTKGRYLMSVTYHEDRKFGDLVISKASERRIVFYVH